MDSEAGSDLDRLGEDLVLMSLAEDGRIVNRKRIGFGLMGSELVRLAAGGRARVPPVLLAGWLLPCAVRSKHGTVRANRF
jgi:hypothetical protein